MALPPSAPRHSRPGALSAATSLLDSTAHVGLGAAPGGFLATVAPATLLAASALHGAADSGAMPRWALFTSVGAASLMFAGALALPRWSGVGGAAVLLGLGVFGAACAPALAGTPAGALGLVLCLLAMGTWAMARRRRGGQRPTAAPGAVDHLAQARSAAAGALGVWVLVVPLGLERAALGDAIFAVSWCISTAFGALAVVRAPTTMGKRVVLGVTAFCAIAAAVAWPAAGWSLTWLALLPAATLAVLRPPLSVTAGLGASRPWDVLLVHPARALVATFMATGLAGAALLALPAAAIDGTSIGSLDAAFTAFSATCVTGLAVRDTATALSPLGQAIALALIQIGGLGIMTFSAAAMIALRRRFSMAHEGAMVELVGSGHRGALIVGLRRLLVITAVAEGVGTVALTLLFAAAGDAPGQALWRGFFTAISAWCNAGFALQTDSLVPYASNPWVLHTVGLLIIGGGLGPVVVVALPDLLRRRRLGLHASLMLTGTALLLIVPTLLFALTEWNHAFAGLDVIDRLHNAWFQSLTTRTAGFNSVDIARLQPATLTVMMALMFIGGGTGSTAGGIKVTTVAVLVLAVIALVRGRPQASAFGWRLPHDSVYRAAAVAVVGFAAALLATVILLLTQAIPFHVAAFEVISALGTVGLTAGGSAQLDEIGKVVILLCMFVGRVGPLTLFLMWGTGRRQIAWRLPEQEVPVG